MAPGPKPTMKRIGLDGYGACAAADWNNSAGNVRAAAMTSAAQKCDGNFMRFLLLCRPAYSAPARQVCPETGQQPD